MLMLMLKCETNEQHTESAQRVGKTDDEWSPALLSALQIQTWKGVKYKGEDQQISTGSQEEVGRGGEEEEEEEEEAAEGR